MNVIQPQKKTILLFVSTWMNCEGIMLRNRSEKDKYHMILPIYEPQKEKIRIKPMNSNI